MPCLPERPLCRVSFKQFSSFLRRCSGDGGRAAKPQILRKSASGNTQYKLTQASTFPGQGASPLTRWGGCPQPANGRCPLTPAVRCRPCTPPQRACRPLYSRSGEAGFHRRSGFRQFHRLRIHTVTPIGGKWIRNTPAGIAGQNAGCRPGIFAVIAPISGDFFFCRYHLKAMLSGVSTGGGFPFLAVRRDEPD